MHRRLSTLFILLTAVVSFSCWKKTSDGHDDLVICKVSTENITGTYHWTGAFINYSNGTSENYFAETDSCRKDDKITFGNNGFFSEDDSGLCNAFYPVQTSWSIADDRHLYIGGQLYAVTLFDCTTLELQRVDTINNLSAVTYFYYTKI